MNILFMSLGEFSDLSKGSVHIDVVRELGKSNNVYLACKANASKHDSVGLTEEYGIHVLRVQTGAIKTNNFVEKGIATLRLEPAFRKAISNSFNKIKFDLVIYTTPPITFVDPIKYIKKRDKAVTYLMLKDIFPQNAVDIGIMSKKGVMAPLYRHFRRKEKKLYALSDHIGCMSPKNIEYIAMHNPEIDSSKLELFPNSVYIREIVCTDNERKSVRTKYGLPIDKKIFVYGGNLGKPQGIPFMLKCIQKVKDIDAYFVIVGNGTEYNSIEEYVRSLGQSNISLFKSLPKNDYDLLVSVCDIGMVFLDHRFEIPNFPSRILSYMQSHLPILAVTDPNTDIGTIIEGANFGWWCESNDDEMFLLKVKEALNSDIKNMGDSAFAFLVNNYDVEKNCKDLIARINNSNHLTNEEKK